VTAEARIPLAPAFPRASQKAQFAQIATTAGTDAERLVKDTALPTGSVVAEMRALHARVKPDPEGWTTRDYVDYVRR